MPLSYVVLLFFFIDCSLLHTEGCRRYNWEGAQNRLINLLRVSNASIFLEPNNCFNEILRTRLMPQFMELNLNSTFSKVSLVCHPVIKGVCEMCKEIKHTFRQVVFQREWSVEKQIEKLFTNIA